MFPDHLIDLAEQVIRAYSKGNLKLATAESCTGGLIAGCLTAVSGASDVLTHGFITYANEAKMNLLGVPKSQLIKHGAVSETVARSMAAGALTKTTTIAVSVTGIAGPGGGSPEKPVGLVHIAVARTGAETRHERHVFTGERAAVRLQTIEAALKMLLLAV